MIMEELIKEKIELNESKLEVLMVMFGTFPYRTEYYRLNDNIFHILGRASFEFNQMNTIHKNYITELLLVYNKPKDLDEIRITHIKRKKDNKKFYLGEYVKYKGNITRIDEFRVTKKGNILIKNIYVKENLNINLIEKIGVETTKFLKVSNGEIFTELHRCDNHGEFLFYDSEEYGYPLWFLMKDEYKIAEITNYENNIVFTLGEYVEYNKITSKIEEIKWEDGLGYIAIDDLNRKIPIKLDK